MQSPEVFVSVSQLAERYSVHVVTIWRWAREGIFPKPIKLTGGCTRWRLSEVEAHESKAEQLDRT